MEHETTPNAILNHLKGHTPTYISGITSLALACVLAYGNVRSGSTHTQDEVTQLKKDVATLQLQVANDLATRRELTDFKADATERLNRIENKLDKELEFHRTR